MRIVNKTKGQLRWQIQAEGERDSSGVIEPGEPPHVVTVKNPARVTVTADGIIFDKVTDVSTITVTSGIAGDS